MCTAPNPVYALKQRESDGTLPNPRLQPNPRSPSAVSLHAEETPSEYLISKLLYLWFIFLCWMILLTRSRAPADGHLNLHETTRSEAKLIMEAKTSHFRKQKQPFMSVQLTINGKNCTLLLKYFSKQLFCSLWNSSKYNLVVNLS